MRTGQTFELGQRNQSTLEPLDLLLAADILDAFEYLTAPVETGHWWFSDACYRRLRTQHWSAVLTLRDELRDFVESAAIEEFRLTPDETELAGAVVECADSLESGLAQATTGGFERVATIVGITGGLLTVALVLGA